MTLIQNFLSIRQSLPGEVKLIVVSKFKPGDSVRELVENTRHLDFAESRVQELLQKAPLLPEAIRWHFIGHLQTNKIRSLIPFTKLIQSVDSFRLLKEINREAERQGKVVGVLLQFHIASEETKYGFSFEESCQMLESDEFKGLSNIDIKGVMGMASFTENFQQVRKEFKSLRSHYEYLKTNYFKESETFSEVSMGMSGDYKIAVEEGSTMVRVGSLIFGER
ncbi:MAG: YggS family pyridoxal phosphate-dependent enzyme [Bacteroidales bacterium]|nr:YggS family pyridoxal phosphate-dependent enzyme [Bacteroidales bacterium]